MAYHIFDNGLVYSALGGNDNTVNANLPRFFSSNDQIRNVRMQQANEHARSNHPRIDNDVVAGKDHAGLDVSFSTSGSLVPCASALAAPMQAHKSRLFRTFTMPVP